MRYMRQLIHFHSLLTQRGHVNTGQVTHVTCDISNVQSSNGFATCFRLVYDPLAHVMQVCHQVFYLVFDLLD